MHVWLWMLSKRAHGFTCSKSQWKLEASTTSGCRPPDYVSTHTHTYTQTTAHTLACAHTLTHIHVHI